MKKTIKILLILLCVYIFSIKVVYAAEPTASIKLNKEDLKPGETVEVTLNVKCEEGVSAIEATLEYDEEVLTLEKKEISEGWLNMGSGAELELVLNEATKVEDIDVCTLTFKVDESVEAETIKVAMGQVKIQDISNNETTIEKIEQTIKINAEETEEEGQEGTEKTLESIEITKGPDKIAYTEGEKFDPTGMVVTAKYSDETSKVVTDYTYSPEGELGKDDTKITVSYTGDGVTKTDDIEITVKEKAAQGKEEGKEDTGKGQTGKNDGTEAGKGMPYAGVKDFIIPVIVVAIFGLISYVGYRKNNI